MVKNNCFMQKIIYETNKFSYSINIDFHKTLY